VSTCHCSSMWGALHGQWSWSGRKVLKGQLLAQSQGHISAPIHAPVSGRVTAIGEVTAPHPSGLGLAAITVESDDTPIAGSRPTRSPIPLPWRPRKSHDAPRQPVSSASAAPPSRRRSSSRSAKRLAVHTLIVNGGECEPYLSSDDRIMRDFAEQVVEGARIIMHAIGARECPGRHRGQQARSHRGDADGRRTLSRR
jgi:electron transport complex protein RnfC